MQVHCRPLSLIFSKCFFFKDHSAFLLFTYFDNADNNADNIGDNNADNIGA